VSDGGAQWREIQANHSALHKTPVCGEGVVLVLLWERSIDHIWNLLVRACICIITLNECANHPIFPPKSAADLNLAAWLTAGFGWRFSGVSRPSRVGDSLLRPHGGGNRDMTSLFTSDDSKGHNSRSRGGPRASVYPSFTIFPPKPFWGRPSLSLASPKPVSSSR